LPTRVVPELRILHADSGIQPEITLGSPDVDPWLDQAGRAYAWSHSKGCAHWIFWNQIARFDFDNNSPFVTVHALPSAGHELLNEIYLEHILPLVLTTRGFEVIHASAIRSPGGVLAFAAFTGTGKSSTAYALHSRGFPLWADDAVVFQIEQGEVFSTPIPFNIRLFPDMLSSIENSLFTGQAEKNIDPHRFQERLPLVGIYLLERKETWNDPRPIQITRLSLEAAFTRLLPHAYAFEQHNPERTQSLAASYLGLVSRIPVCQLSYSSNREALPEFITALEGLIRI
jgi:hypothetical protein